MAHFPKPAEGSWTEHLELDTGPVSYEDSISPEHYELEREAIFKRTWLNVGRMEQLPRTGAYFTKELDAAGTSVIIVRNAAGEARAFHNMCRHRGNKLVWQDFPQEETSGVVPPVHLQVPRLALRPRRRAHLRAAGVGVLRPRPRRLRPGAAALRGVGGLHLRQPRRRGAPAARLHGSTRRRPRGLPVRQAHPGPQVPRGGREQLEALHRRLHGVLPRTCSAREAVGGRGVAQAAGVRLRGRCTTTPTVRTAWCRRGAAWRRRRTSRW